MKHLIILTVLLLAITGCFDTTLQPPGDTAGEMVGCVIQDADLLCLSLYPAESVVSVSTPTAEGVYRCAVADASHVYDGDTISRVQILIKPLDLQTVNQIGEIFPNIVLEADGIYVQNGIRIAGIDTPEMRPSKSGRTQRSRENEKKAARNARDAVIRLLEVNAFVFTITNVDMDKYGRVLAVVYAGDVNVGEYLIANRLALRYDGGTKAQPDWESLDQGLMW